MLVVGQLGWGPTAPTHLTPNEQLTHITLWCLLSAPLLIGCDLCAARSLTTTCSPTTKCWTSTRTRWASRPASALAGRHARGVGAPALGRHHGRRPLQPRRRAPADRHRELGRPRPEGPRSPCATSGSRRTWAPPTTPSRRGARARRGAGQDRETEAASLRRMGSWFFDTAVAEPPDETNVNRTHRIQRTSSWSLTR